MRTLAPGAIADRFEMQFVPVLTVVEGTDKVIQYAA